ncbi:MAG: phenylacetate--CoA ligase family protein [archaeon]|nr:phenylacetate--CoA ligase family protein [archaeon]
MPPPNPFERWAHQRIKELLNKKDLDEITKSDLERYRLYRLKETVRYAYDRSIFYKKLFEEKRIRPEDINSFEDFRRIPFTTAKDVLENPYLFLCITQDGILRGFTSEEADGRFRRIFFTMDELLNIVDSISAALNMLGVGASDVIQIVFPFEAEWGCNYLVEEAIRRVGGEPVSTGAIDFDEQVKKIFNIKPKMMIGSNPYLVKMTRLVSSRYDLRKAEVKTIVLSRGCEFYPFTESMREEIERAWGCNALDHYGTMEAGMANAIECPYRNGLHLNEADFYYEVVDVKSKETLKPGEEGELVITTLSRLGMPLIRFRSRDVSYLIDKSCKCGILTLRSIGGIKRKLKNGSQTRGLLESLNLIKRLRAIL